MGHIKETEPGESEVILVSKGQFLMGTVELGGRSFEIDPNKIAPQYEPEELEHPSDADLAAAAVDTAAATAPEPASTGQVIDVLIAYIPKARANAGGVAGIETRIVNAVTKPNQAYQNSKIPCS